MAEEKVRCKEEFDKFLKTTEQWIEEQKEMLEVKPTPEKIEQITKLYSEVIGKGKKWATCEITSS